LVKVSRLTETPSSKDSVLDGIAYFALYQTILEAEQDANFEWED
jgi:hypothetical protein